MSATRIEPEVLTEAPVPRSPTVFSALLRRWWMVALGAAVGLAISAAIMPLLPVRYAAELRAAPVQSEAGLARSLGSLAAVAGLSTPRTPTPPFAIYIAMLTSQSVASELARDPKIMRTFFQSEWDSERGLWREPDTARYRFVRSVKRSLGLPNAEWRPPDARRLRRALGKTVVIVENRRDSIVTMSMEAEDGAFAAYVLRAVHTSADGILRRAAINRSDAQIAYVGRMLRTVQLAEHRQALAETLGEQERTRMLANAGTSYAATALGIVAISDKPVSPVPLLVLGLGVVLGAGLAAAAVLGLHLRRGRT